MSVCANAQANADKCVNSSSGIFAQQGVISTGVVDELKFSSDTVKSMLALYRFDPSVAGPAIKYLSVVDNLRRHISETGANAVTEYSFFFPSMGTCEFTGESAGGTVTHPLARPSQLDRLSCLSIKQNVAALLANYLEYCESPRDVLPSTTDASIEPPSLSPVWNYVADRSFGSLSKTSLLIERGVTSWPSGIEEGLLTQRMLNDLVQMDIEQQGPLTKSGLTMEIVGWSIDEKGEPSLVSDQQWDTLGPKPVSTARAIDVLKDPFSTKVIYDPKTFTTVGAIVPIALPDTASSFATVNPDAATVGVSEEFFSTTEFGTHAIVWNADVVDSKQMKEIIFNSERHAVFDRTGVDLAKISPEIEGFVWFDYNVSKLSRFLARHGLTESDLDPEVLQLIQDTK